MSDRHIYWPYWVFTTLKAGKDRFDWIGFKARFFSTLEKMVHAFCQIARVIGESFPFPPDSKYV